MIKYLLVFAAVGVLLLGGVARMAAQGTAFTYFGDLTGFDGPDKGDLDFHFTIYNGAMGTNQVGPTLAFEDILIMKKTFAVTLDFGSNVFTGDPRWIEIAVRKSPKKDEKDPKKLLFTVLDPRQAILPVPYAIHAATAGSATSVSGPITDTALPANVARLNANQTFTGTPTFFPPGGPPFVVGSTGKVMNLNADLLDGLDSTAFALRQHTHAAADITSGVLADARLGSNVALLNGNAAFDGVVSAASFRGSGAFLSNLPAANLTGTIPDARLSSNVALLASHQTFTGSNVFGGMTTLTNQANVISGAIGGDGAALGNLNASRLTAGTVPDARLAPNVARLDGNAAFTGAVSFNPAAGPPFAVGNSNLVAGLNAALVGGLDANSLWKLGGNAAPGGSFLGTVNDRPLEFRVNNSKVLEIGKNSVFAYPQGGSTGPSFARTGTYFLRQTSTNANRVEMFLDGIGQRLIIPLNSAWSVDIYMVGIGASGTGARFVYMENTFLANFNGTITMGNFGVRDDAVGNFVGAGFPSTSGDALVFHVNSNGNQTVRWFAVIKTIEVTF